MTARRSFKIATLCIALGAGSTLIGGCATLRHEKQASEAAQHHFHQLSAQHSPSAKQPVVDSSYPYLMGPKIARKKAIPAALRQDVVLNSGASMTLHDIASRVSTMTGIPVDVVNLENPAFASETQNGSSGASSTASMSASTASIGAGGTTSNGTNGQNMANGEPPPYLMSVSLHWSGPLHGLLDAVASRFGVTWSFHDGRVRIYKYETKTFPLGMSVMNTGIQSAIGTNGKQSSSTSSGGGASSIKTTGKTTLNPYQDVLAGVRAIIGNQGVVSANPSLGALTVTTTPVLMGDVKTYVNQQNGQAARNVLIGVRIYQVVASDNLNLAASMSATFNQIAKHVDVSMLGTPTTDSSSLLSAIIGGANVPSGLTNGGVDMTTTNKGILSASQAVVRALRSIGMTRLVTSGSVMTANGQPGPIQVGQTINYVASSHQSISNGTATASLQSKALNVGFTGNFLPRLLGQHRIMLNYQMQLSSLVNIKTVSTAQTTIQLPHTDSQSASQSVVLKNGQTLVLAGFGSSNFQRGAGLGLGSGYRGKNSQNNWLVILIHVQEVNP